MAKPKPNQFVYEFARMLRESFGIEFVDENGRPIEFAANKNKIKKLKRESKPY